MKRITSDGIAAAIRRRICLEPPTSISTLHEHALAQEFGVSRTPIRQALQRLAYERLVEIRSGVGTLVMPLDPKTKSNDTRLAFMLIRLAADYEGDRPLTSETAARIRALSLEIHDVDQVSLELNYTIRVETFDLMMREMSSPILADALRAAIWRLFRWRLAEAAKTNDGFDPRFRPVIEGLGAATRAGTLRALFDVMLDTPAAH